jgi:hypothetical protein
MSVVISRVDLSLKVPSPTYPLMELASDGLAGHQTTLAHQKSTICIEGGNSEHDLLRAVLKHSLLTLF